MAKAAAEQTNEDTGVRMDGIGRNNPSLQQAEFAPVKARYIRLTALQEVNRNGWTSAAEISVLPVDGEGQRQ
jgi:hypothetical protein